MRKSVCGFILLFSFYILTSLPVFAEDPFGDFFDSADEEFLKLKKQADDEFAELSKLDTEFAEILNRAWTELELSTGIQPDAVPKPDIIPVARPSDIPDTPVPPAPPQPAEPPEPEEKTELPPEPVVIPKEVEVPERAGIPLRFAFFETPVELFLDPAIKASLGGPVSEKTISAFWEDLACASYQDLIEQTMAHKTGFALNDWGYCLLLDTFSGALYGAAKPERPLFIWFLLIKSGYDARVGFTGDNVYLLLPSAQTVYNVPFYELGGERYYLTWLGTEAGDVTSLYTYDKNYPEAVQLIDYTLLQAPDLTKSFFEKDYSFNYIENGYDVSLAIDQNKVEFYDRYPQTNLDVYFRAPVTGETARSLLDGIRPFVAGKPEGEAINIILRFVQTAFEYKTDGDQFGYEKYMFPEETLFYPYSDCEDRSFLFAYLVRNLLGLEVIGLDYPGHIATAVRFTDTADGDSVIFSGVRYTICDPTYINATWGECMPQFKDVSPGVIEIPAM